MVDLSDYFAIRAIPIPITTMYVFSRGKAIPIPITTIGMRLPHFLHQYYCVANTAGCDRLINQQGEMFAEMFAALLSR